MADVTETESQRQRQLERRKTKRKTQSRQLETAQRREERLLRRRVRDRARHANESAEQRDIRLEAMCTQWTVMRTLQTDHLANETAEHGELWLQHRRQREQHQPQERLSSFQLLNQPSIQTELSWSSSIVHKISMGTKTSPATSNHVQIYTYKVTDIYLIHKNVTFYVTYSRLAPCC